MVLVQKWPFFQLIFWGNLDQENFFCDILERKNTFLRYKNKKCKEPKNWLFPNGLTHGFGPKMAIFPTLFFKEFRKGKVNRWFWPKNGHFSNFFFLRNLGQENVFYDILERKNAFLGYKNKK